MKTTEEKVNERVKSELTPIDAEQLFRDALNEQGEVQVGNLTFDPSRIVEELDPIAFRCGVNDYLDSISDQYEEIDGEYYDTSEVQDIRDEVEAEEEQEEETDGE